MKNTNKTTGFLERTYNGRKEASKRTALLITMLTIFSLSLISLTGFVSAEDMWIYSESNIYSPSSHNYNIPDSLVNYVTIKTRGTSAGESVCMTFNYAGGSTYTTPCQTVAYLSWVENRFTNINPTRTVTSITVNGGSHTYMKEINVYGSCTIGTDGCNGDNGGYDEETGYYCGDGVKEGTEECDKGTSNGEACNPLYGSSCTYCSTGCKLVTVKGDFCGDGKLNPEYEKCDDGNTYDGDGCSSQCKKPFQVTVEGFEPIVWGCDSRVVYDDGTEPGRITMKGDEIIERMNNYAFEGEKIQWKVLVMDKNGIEKVKDVRVIVDGNIEANCDRLDEYFSFPNNDGYTNKEGLLVEGCGIDPTCNARILEEQITTFNEDTMAYYLCTLTVETPESMYGELEVTVEAEDMDGILSTMDELENWFFNPFIQLYIDGDINFDEVRPGTSSYSRRVLVGNDADDGSGVMLDMFISGTDFYDSSSSGAKCPTTNQLSLSNFAYYASNGGYSTNSDTRKDAEGYVPIQYGIGFNDPKPFYNRNEVIQAGKVGTYYAPNILSPGSEMSIIFRLNLPEPCNGDFDTGQIYFWGEAV